MVSFMNPFKGKRENEASGAGSGNILSRISSATSGRRQSISSNGILRRLSLLSNDSAGNDGDAESDDVLSYNDYSDVEDGSELNRYMSHNADKFDRRTLNYLRLQGLSAPEIVNDGSVVRVSVSSNGENVFLPSSVNLNEEAMENYGLEDDTVRFGGPAAGPAGGATGGASDACDLESADDCVAHTFAVIVSLNKTMAFTTVAAQLQAVSKVQWPNGLPSNPNLRAETFELGSIDWNLNLDNYNYYTPLAEDVLIDDEDELDQCLASSALKIAPQVFQTKSPADIMEADYLSGKPKDDQFVQSHLHRDAQAKFYPAGDYVFIVPVLFPATSPESMYTEHSIVYYKLKLLMIENQSKNHITTADKIVNIVRGPPLRAVTTTDKPIFVNKVWNNVLNYEISFPQKFVRLGSELPIKIKLVPLTKDLCVKRIKVNVQENITYVSKNLCYEYEEKYLNTMNISDRHQLDNIHTPKCITLFELRTKEKPSQAVKQYVVKQAADTKHRDNLLSNCFASEAAADPEFVDIVGPLAVSTYLNFFNCYKLLRDTGDGYVRDLQQGLKPILKQNHLVNRKLETRIINSSTEIDTVPTIQEPRTSVGFYPDSSNNKYISVSHKLQIMLRISKQDEADPDKTRHYEIVIDTPVFLLNHLCVSENIELPTYESAVQNGSPLTTDHLPTFAEAVVISPMASPTLAPCDIHETGISRTSSIGSNDLSTSMNNIDNLLQSEATPLGGLLRTRRDSSIRRDIARSLGGGSTPSTASTALTSTALTSTTASSGGATTSGGTLSSGGITTSEGTLSSGGATTSEGTLSSEGPSRSEGTASSGATADNLSSSDSNVDDTDRALPSYTESIPLLSDESSG